MSLSVYYEDKDIINQLRGFFELDEQWVIDFEACLSQIEDVDDEYYELKIKDRIFRIHKIIGNVFEVE